MFRRNAERDRLIVQRRNEGASYRVIAEETGVTRNRAGEIARKAARAAIRAKRAADRARDREERRTRGQLNEHERADDDLSKALDDLSKALDTPAGLVPRELISVLARRGVQQRNDIDCLLTPDIQRHRDWRGRVTRVDGRCCGEPAWSSLGLNLDDLNTVRAACGVEPFVPVLTRPKPKQATFDKAIAFLRRHGYIVTEPGAP